MQFLAYEMETRDGNKVQCIVRAIEKLVLGSNLHHCIRGMGAGEMYVVVNVCVLGCTVVGLLLQI